MQQPNQLFDRYPLYAELRRRGMAAWAENLRAICAKRLSPEAHGSMPEWISAWHQLPPSDGCHISVSGPAVMVSGPTQPDQEHLRRTLMQFHPWRKGPFELFGLAIDTEWRSDLKWNRLVEHVAFADKAVLDVGCGNGYYGWRMLAAGAQLVLGCDPFPLYIQQYEVLRRYAAQPERHFVVPLADHELPPVEYFEVTLSMGVLYHRTSPIDHLQTLWRTLKPGGQLVLETLVLESAGCHVLIPEGRYAKMRNVWFIPSLSMLETWLRRTGFDQINVLDVMRTTTQEQRSTAWMHFESLPDFLHPADAQRTLEGYPGPVRGLLTARRRA